MYSPPAQNPLSEADYERINQQLNDLAKLRDDLQRANAAGEDTATREQHCDYLCQRLNAFKAAYFPNRP